jgi:hypothetical protein
MVSIDRDSGPWLRPILPLGEHAARVAHSEIFERGGWVVQPDQRLSQIVHRRPPGVTAHQWSSASRTHFDFVVCDARTYTPVFAVTLDDPIQGASGAARTDRMTNAVCATVGLELLRIESSALRQGSHGRRILEYVIDARNFMDASDTMVGDPTAIGATAIDFAGSAARAGSPGEQPLSFRDIVGRLPDGRSGFVNDLGAVARAAAVEVYVSRQLADPIIRGLHVRWKDGPAEGWGWIEVREGLCIFERTRVWRHRLSCGIDPGQLAEDLAAVAIGERLKTLGTAEPVLHEKAQLGRDFDQLKRRRDEMENGFAFDHVSFGRPETN